MTKNDTNRIIKSLSDLGIVSDKRTLKPINTGSFRFKYPVNNFLITSDKIIEFVQDNPDLDTYKILRLVLDDVIDKNEADYFALMGIYNVLAWAAFENENKDHFRLNQKRIHAHFVYQYDADFAEKNKDITKTQVVIIPDNSNCDMCRKLEGEKFEIMDFLGNMPIPVKGCTKSNGICIALGCPVSVML